MRKEKLWKTSRIISDSFIPSNCKLRLHKQLLCDNFYTTNTFDRVDSAANICQQSSKFSAPVMALDSRDTIKQGGAT